jgi:hypothetical protein
MAIKPRDLVRLDNSVDLYWVARIAHGRALILPIIRGGARLVPLSRLAQVAAVPTTT